MTKVELRQPAITEIVELLNDAQSIIIVDYRGLIAEQDIALRKQLRKTGIAYKVYKNTMARFAAKSTDFEALDPHLERLAALTVSKTDTTVAARIPVNFAEKANALKTKGGIMEGTYYDVKEMNVTATTPSREELFGKLFGSIQSPITNFVRILNQIAEFKET